MSLVGPRPLLMRYTPYFTDEERIRFMVRPGITGLAQVSGRNNLNWDLRIAMDVRYVRECSLALDLRILFLTVWHTFTRRGVQEDPAQLCLTSMKSGGVISPPRRGLLGERRTQLSGFRWFHYPTGNFPPRVCHL